MFKINDTEPGRLGKNGPFLRQCKARRRVSAFTVTCGLPRPIADAPCECPHCRRVLAAQARKDRRSARLFGEGFAESRQRASHPHTWAALTIPRICPLGRGPLGEFVAKVLSAKLTTRRAG